MKQRKSRTGPRGPTEDLDTPATEAARIDRSEEAPTEAVLAETPPHESEDAPEFGLASEPPSTDPDPHLMALDDVASATPPLAESAQETEEKSALDETPRFEDTTPAALTLAAPMITEAPLEALPLTPVEPRIPDLTLPAESEKSALVAALEERVRRLEESLSQLQNTQPLEERITEQVAARLESQVAARPPDPTDLLLAAGKKLLTTSEPAPTGRRPPGRQPWLLADLFIEMRCILRLLVDPRYRLSWETRLFAPLVILGIIMSWSCLSGLPLIGLLLDKVLGLVLVFVLYKILNREARRYRETSPDLPASLRL